MNYIKTWLRGFPLFFITIVGALGFFGILLGIVYLGTAYPDMLFGGLMVILGIIILIIMPYSIGQDL